MIKSRLVVKGCEETEACPTTFAPTASKEVVVLALNVMANKHGTPKTVEVEKAFLHSEDIERDVYLEPPIEADMPSKIVWRLSKAAFGLGGEAREWLKKLDRILKFLGLTSSRNEPALYYMNRNHQSKGKLLSHVDNLLYAGDGDFEKAMGRLEQYIKIGKKAEKKFKFVLWIFNSYLQQFRYPHWSGTVKTNSLGPTEILAPIGEKRMLEGEK